MPCPRCGASSPTSANFCAQCGQPLRAEIPQSRRRIVISGIGAVSPLGLSADETWRGLVAGQSGIRRVQGFDPSGLPVQIAGEVSGVSVSQWVDAKVARQMAKFSQFAVAAAGMALDDAGLEPTSIDPDRAGVVVGTGAGGMATILETQEVAQRRGLMKVSPFFSTRADGGPPRLVPLVTAKSPYTTAQCPSVL